SLSYLIPRPPLPPPFPTRRSSDLHALDVTQRQGQRRHEAQRIRPRRIEQQTCLERLCRDLSSERLAERQRPQQAAAAHLAKPVPFCKLGKRGGECLSLLRDAHEKIRPRHLAEHRDSRGTHQRISIEGATLVAVREAACRLGCEQGSKWHTAAKALTEGQNVRLDPDMLEVEHLARAPDAGLDFVEDQ